MKGLDALLLLLLFYPPSATAQSALSKGDHELELWTGGGHSVNGVDVMPVFWVFEPNATAYVSSKEVDTAKELLAQLSMAEIPAFLDYALAEAGKTRFNPQTLGGVRQYLNRYLQDRHRRTSSQAAAVVRQSEERQTQLRLDYDHYRRSEAQRLFDSLPPGEQASIEALARAKLDAGGPISDFMTATLLRVEKLRLTIERQPGQIADFDQWSASHSS